MKILELTIKNFMAVGAIEALPLDDRGLILIQGENLDDSSQDSNGAGKSTIAEALCWALYGKTARGETGDAVVNDVAKKGTEVSIKLLDETGAVYRVSRYRKHKTYKNMLRLELQEGEGWKDLTKGNDKLTQELIDKAIGCTHEVFSSAIYAGQEAMPDLPGMTDKQLKVLVEEAAGINELQQAHEIAKQELAGAKLKVQELTTGINNAIANIASAKARIADAEARFTQAEDERADSIRALSRQLATAEKSYDPKLVERIEERLQKLAREAEEINTKIAGTDDERKKQAQLQKEERELAIAAVQAESQYDAALKQAREAKREYDCVDHKVGTACHACGHVIGEEDLADSKAAAHSAALKTAQAAKQLKEAAARARERAVSASDALKAFSAAMTDVSELMSSLRTVDAARAKLEGALRTQQQFAQQIDQLKKEITRVANETNPYDAIRKKAQEDLDALQSQLDHLEAERTTAMQRQELCEEAVRVFGPAGVRAHILDTVTPYLNSRTAHYLSALTDGNISAVWSTVSTTAKGELREKFVIDVASSTGAKSFRGLSGGEKRKVRLACAMGLQDLVSSRASKPIKLFVADEIDHALDQAGLERLMTILEEKANDKGTVLVISHSDLRDWIKNSITVVKKDGQSSLEGVCP